ncbi:MAG: aminoglycoside 3-N-acetyltransferase [Dokdonia sp.]|jgi:aminoglycoside 3-N-acetyltransferase
MKTQIYKFLFEKGQKVKKALGIENFEALKKKKKRKLLRVFYKKKYTTNDIIEVMRTMGMKKGSIVFIHSSMTEFYNYVGTAEELITRVIQEIGEEGTLMMPAFPKFENIIKVDDKVDFDVRYTPSGAGYLTEVFRKHPGVKRSINIQQSVCAYGRLADYFVLEHHHSLTAWDEYSPYYKMSQAPALVFAFGLSAQYLGTMIHCTESILRTKYMYFQMFFKKEVVYKYRDYEGNVRTHCYLSHDFARKSRKNNIIKYIESIQFKHTKISNLSIRMIDAKYILDLYLQLADRGITMYSIPSTKGFLDDSGKFLKIK